MAKVVEALLLGYAQHDIERFVRDEALRDGMVQQALQWKCNADKSQQMGEAILATATLAATFDSRAVVRPRYKAAARGP